MTRIAGALLATLAVAIGTLAPFSSAQDTAAQGQPSFDRLVVTVLPEYDQPRVLVIVKGELPADTPMPLTAQLRVPGDATVTNTCSINANDEQVCTQSTSQPEGQDQIVTYDLSTPGLYVEYYYGSFSGAGQRSADFSFWPPFPADKLELAIPVPTDATDFNAVPAPARTMDDQGSKHLIYTYDNVAVGAPINLTLTYSRTTDQPWAPPPQPGQGSASAPLDPNEDGGMPRDAILFLALAAALTVAFIGYNTVGRRLRFDMGLVEGPRPAGESGRGGPPAAIFCRNCGASSRRAAGYCSSCGNALQSTPGNRP